MNQKVAKISNLKMLGYKALKNANKAVEFEADGMRFKLTYLGEVAIDKKKKSITAIKRKMNSREGLTKEERKMAIKAGLIDKDQEWFWTREWQRGESEADRDERLADTSGPFQTAKAAIKHLHSLAKSKTKKL